MKISIIIIINLINTTTKVNLINKTKINIINNSKVNLIIKIKINWISKDSNSNSILNNNTSKTKINIINTSNNYSNNNINKCCKETNNNRCNNKLKFLKSSTSNRIQTIKYSLKIQFSKMKILLVKSIISNKTIHNDNSNKDNIFTNKMKSKIKGTQTGIYTYVLITNIKN